MGWDVIKIIFKNVVGDMGIMYIIFIFGVSVFYFIVWNILFEVKYGGVF